MRVKNSMLVLRSIIFVAGWIFVGGCDEKKAQTINREVAEKIPSFGEDIPDDSEIGDTISKIEDAIGDAKDVARKGEAIEALKAKPLGCPQLKDLKKIDAKNLDLKSKLEACSTKTTAEIVDNDVGLSFSSDEVKIIGSKISDEDNVNLEIKVTESKTIGDQIVDISTKKLSADEFENNSFSPNTDYAVTIENNKTGDVDHFVFTTLAAPPTIENIEIKDSFVYVEIDDKNNPIETEYAIILISNNFSGWLDIQSGQFNSKEPIWQSFKPSHEKIKRLPTGYLQLKIELAVENEYLIQVLAKNKAQIFTELTEEVFISQDKEEDILPEVKGPDVPLDTLTLEELKEKINLSKIVVKKSRVSFKKGEIDRQELKKERAHLLALKKAKRLKLREIIRAKKKQVLEKLRAKNKNRKVKLREKKRDWKEDLLSRNAGKNAKKLTIKHNKIEAQMIKTHQKKEKSLAKKHQKRQKELLKKHQKIQSELEKKRRKRLAGEKNPEKQQEITEKFDKKREELAKKHEEKEKDLAKRHEEKEKEILKKHETRRENLQKKHKEKQQKPSSKLEKKKAGISEETEIVGEKSD